MPVTHGDRNESTFLQLWKQKWQTATVYRGFALNDGLETDNSELMDDVISIQEARLELWTRPVRQATGRTRRQTVTKSLEPKLSCDWSGVSQSDRSATRSSANVR